MEQGMKHHRRNNRKAKTNVRAAKPTYVREPMEQEPCIPVSLHEYFPKDNFQQCTIAACHMVEIEIEEPSYGKVIAVEEGKSLMPKEGLPTYFNLEEALLLPKEMRKALIVILASPDDHEVQKSKNKGLRL
ncbi:hypothetical protein ACFX19_035102 [Malus domestica]